MSRAVRRPRDFEADFLRLLESILSAGDESWISILLDGVKQASRMLGRFPAAGVLLAQRGSVVLRKLILRRGPYVAWYVYDTEDPDGDVWLVRLFHARQRRPLPRPGRWVSAGGRTPKQSRRSRSR
jgi:plasmid stabilization system protein ParE